MGCKLKFLIPNNIFALCQKDQRRLPQPLRSVSGKARLTFRSNCQQLFRNPEVFGARRGSPSAEAGRYRPPLLSTAFFCFFSFSPAIARPLGPCPCSALIPSRSGETGYAPPPPLSASFYFSFCPEQFLPCFAPVRVPKIVTLEFPSRAFGCLKAASSGIQL